MSLPRNGVDCVWSVVVAHTNLLFFLQNSFCSNILDGPMWLLVFCVSFLRWCGLVCGL